MLTDLLSYDLLLGFSSILEFTGKKNPEWPTVTKKNWSQHSERLKALHNFLSETERYSS